MAKSFKLDDEFIHEYRHKEPPFGFDGLGKFTYMRTYSRVKEDGTNEAWHETLRRVVEGCYSMQKDHVQKYNLGWDEDKAQRSAQEMYERMFEMKFLPAGRGLWAMGSKLTEERDTYEALFNCAFTSTKNLPDEPAKPFCYLMDLSMLGVGVGFDTKGAGTITVEGPSNEDPEEYVVPDSREGWVESVRRLLNSYFYRQAPMEFDYSEIRPPGAPIKGFGGTSSGYEPLERLHNDIRKTLDRNAGKPITTRSIVDIQNMIGRCVIAGNVRRSAELAIGDPENEEYLDLKDYDKYPERQEYGWASNNSIDARIGMDYSEAAERTRLNGEPGYIWLQNARRYGRMKDGVNRADENVMGFNPCVTLCFA